MSLHPYVALYDRKGGIEGSYHVALAFAPAVDLKRWEDARADVYQITNMTGPWESDHLRDIIPFNSERCFCLVRMPVLPSDFDREGIRSFIEECHPPLEVDNAWAKRAPRWNCAAWVIGVLLSMGESGLLDLSTWVKEPNDKSDKLLNAIYVKTMKAGISITERKERVVDLKE